MMSGGLTEAASGKLSEPSVSDAMSGLAEPSRSSTAARCSKRESERPLVVATITTSGCAARIAEKIRS